MSRGRERSRPSRVAEPATTEHGERFTSAARADVSRLVCRWAIAALAAQPAERRTAARRKSR